MLIYCSIYKYFLFFFLKPIFIEITLFQIEYNDRVHTSTLKAKSVPPVVTKSNVDDNEDDVDIDAI